MIAFQKCCWQFTKKTEQRPLESYRFTGRWIVKQIKSFDWENNDNSPKKAFQQSVQF